MEEWDKIKRTEQTKLLLFHYYLSNMILVTFAEYTDSQGGSQTKHIAAAVSIHGPEMYFNEFKLKLI